MELDVIRGAHAQSQLSEAGLLSSWNALYDRCEWSTAFQKPEFVRTWYSVYGERYDPLVVTGASSERNLIGFWALAVDRVAGQLMPCGWPNAEYYCWLADRDHSNEFITRALSQLWRQFPKGKLALLFLPPGMPLDWVSARHKALKRVVPRPIRDLSQDTSAASLRKKSNRSRLRRLERLGPVEFRQIQSRAELEQYIDKLAVYCDLRQGAVSGSLPFREDPLKRELFLRLLDCPGLVHASALTVGGELAASHIGFFSKSELSLGFIAHSPFLAEHSPGKLLLLFLASRLAELGVARFDLTPGGKYKERFHNAHDDAYVVRVFARRRDYIRFWCLRWMLTAAKRVFTLAGIDTAALSTVSNGKAVVFPLAKVVRGLLRSARRAIRFRREPLVYTLERDPKLLHSCAGCGINRNRVSDLTLYRPGSSCDRTLQEFLSDAVAPLSRGDQVYTAVISGELAYCGWLSNSAEGSMVLREEFINPHLNTCELRRRAIHARVRDAIEAGAEHVFAEVRLEDLCGRRILEESGFGWKAS
jgi:CelD/BcsL family acetyltransferase involved in cellulose biosynthesis